MPTLDELLQQQQQQQDSTGDLQQRFNQTFGLDGWEFQQQGSIAYAVLNGANNTQLRLTAIPSAYGAEWQLNGISLPTTDDESLDIEARREILAAAARRAGYIPRSQEQQRGS